MGKLLAALFWCNIVLATPTFGVQIYVKVEGEFVAVPGDYIITQARSPSGIIRNKRSLETGTVSVNGTLVQKTPAEIFALYATLGNSADRRKVLAPIDQYSTGDCEVKETITWPARCYPTANGAMHICRSNARGIIELRGATCAQGMNIYDLFLNNAQERRRR